MEESVRKELNPGAGADNPDLAFLLKETFALPERDWSQYSPLTLAYMGDCIYDLVVRTILVSRANRPTAKLHKTASAIVRAGAQAELIESLLPLLTKEEEAIYRRGCNAKPGHQAKNATLREYLEATGFEALLGYLYLSGNYARLIELVQIGLERTGCVMRQSDHPDNKSFPRRK